MEKVLSKSFLSEEVLPKGFCPGFLLTPPWATGVGGRDTSSGVSGMFTD